MKRILIIASIVLLVLGSFAFAEGKQEGAAKAKTIKVAHFYDPAGGGAAAKNYEWFENIIEQYESNYPNVTVEMEVFQWDQIDVKAMSDYRAGIEEHDVFLTSPQLMAQHGLVGDLLDISNYVNNEWTQEDIDDFSWASPWKKTTVGGKFLGIPLGAHTRTMLYRTDRFREAGLDPNSPPRDLNELVGYGKKLTKDTDGDGNTDQWGCTMFFGPSRATIELYVAPQIWHYGGELWDPDTKQATFASDAGVKAAQFNKDLMHKHKITPETAVAGTYNDNIMQDFVDGVASMTWGWGSYWISVLEDQGFAKGVFPPTRNPEMIKADVSLLPTKPQAAFTNAWFVSIYKMSQNPDEAWDFIRLMLEPDNIIDYPDAGLPIRESLWEEPEFQNDFYQTWKAAVEKGRPMPPTAHYGELSDTVAAAMQEILVNNADIESTLQRAQDEYNEQYGGE